MLIIRRVAGRSMEPSLGDGRLVMARRWPRRIKQGDVVIVRHEGLEKIKRVQSCAAGRVYVVGDNPALSTDSRDFGWLDERAIMGIVVWPRRAV